MRRSGRWCRKFGQTYTNALCRRRLRPGDKWHLDVSSAEGIQDRTLDARRGKALGDASRQARTRSVLDGHRGLAASAVHTVPEHHADHFGQPRKRATRGLMPGESFPSRRSW